MRTFLFLFCVLIPQLAAAATDSAIPLRLRPSRSVEVNCTNAYGSKAIEGSSDELTILRVGENIIGYEVYVNGFIVSSCQSISLQYR